jgi:hypothetical protein
MKTYPALHKAARHEDVSGSGSIALRILNHGIKCRWVVSFTPQPLYSREKSPPFPLERRKDGPQSMSGRGGEEKKIPAPSANQTPAVQPIA